MIQFVLTDARCQVAQTPDGKARQLVISDPQSGITVVVPFDVTAARQVGNALASVIHVVNGSDMPPEAA